MNLFSRCCYEIKANIKGFIKVTFVDFASSKFMIFPFILILVSKKCENFFTVIWGMMQNNKNCLVPFYNLF